MSELRIKFRQSQDYNYEMLIRDLIEYAKEMEAKIKELEARLTAGGL